MDIPVRRRPANSALLGDLRSLRVAVLHPDDSDGLHLIQQLQRIGCHTQGFWPPPLALPDSIDVVFVAVRPDIIHHDMTWRTPDMRAALIAIVTYENPTIVQTVLELGAHAVMPSPVRSFGVLSTLVVARDVQHALTGQIKQIRKLEARLLGQRRLTDAKAVLMQTRGISEDAAYELIRAQAMAKRMSMDEIATAIINANEILNLGKT
ncbi:ANTAR domain-containing response regulator [Diaphorobacter aerolatus]|uniref:ANTAR domain-containing response regulator n=1 Tax=Diaphorobacter aerolatus TaxID=1288495 RepID=UPI001D02E457|nr:ANTAR domain-containing protein [Diaphorobacter aerolatus]